MKYIYGKEIMDKSLGDMTLTELRNIENFMPTKPFKDVVLVPMRKTHESGFRCMKFILVRHGEIVGAVSGWSDVMHINGIGGYGKDFNETIKTRKVDLTSWKIDCLAKSGCMRLFTDKDLELDDPFIGSDFYFYVK